MKSLHAAAAGGWNDAVHAQIDDHLSVVVHQVRNAEGRHAAARAVAVMTKAFSGVMPPMKVCACVNESLSAWMMSALEVFFSIASDFGLHVSL